MTVQHWLNFVLDLQEFVVKLDVSCGNFNFTMPFFFVFLFVVFFLLGFAFAILCFCSFYKLGYLYFSFVVLYGLPGCSRNVRYFMSSAMTIFLGKWMGFVDTFVTETKNDINGKMLATPLATMTSSFSCAWGFDSISDKPAIVDTTSTGGSDLNGFIVCRAMHFLFSLWFP